MSKSTRPVVGPLLMRLALALIGAGLMAVGQPPRLWWIATFAGLLLFIGGLRGLSPRFAFWFGTAAGSLFAGLSVPWFANIFPGATPFALFLMLGLFYGLFAAVASWLAPRFPSPWMRAFWVASWWLAVEFYRAEYFHLCFPWLTPGVALGPTWLTPVIGVYGQSFLAVWTAVLLLEVFVPPKDVPRRPRESSLCIPAIAGGIVLLALSCFRPPPVAPREPVRVALVQFEDGDFEKQFELTRAAANSPQLVVWPETSFFGDPRKDYRAQLRQLMKHSADSNTHVTIGCRTDFGDGMREWYNTALTFDGTTIVGEHVKNRLVHLFNDGTRGTNATAFPTRLGKIGTSICFDNDYTDVARRMTASGAEFFAVPSRDASSWGDLQRLQHTLLFRLRAAECGRWYAVASAAGITQIVDPAGNVAASLPPYEPAVLCGTIGIERGLTLYVRCGWLIPWVTAGVALVAGLIVAFRRIR